MLMCNKNKFHIQNLPSNYLEFAKLPDVGLPIIDCKYEKHHGNIVFRFLQSNYLGEMCHRLGTVLK